MVTGKMVALRRNEREVVLDDGSIVPYDHLILTPGLQVRGEVGEGGIEIKARNQWLKENIERKGRQSIIWPFFQCSFVI